MSPQMPFRPPRLRRGRRIHTQTQTASTSLAAIALTRHSALTIVQLRTRAQRVPTETLPSVLGARHAEALRGAVSHALGVCDRLLADVCECDSG
jgi:hypothetical protein